MWNLFTYKKILFLKYKEIKRNNEEKTYNLIKI